MAMHFAPLIVGHRLAQRFRFTVQHGRETVDDRLGASVVHPGQHHETRGALDQRAHRRAVAFTLDQVAFPVPGDDVVLDFWRADMDALHVLYLTAPIGAATARFANLVVVS